MSKFVIFEDLFKQVILDPIAGITKADGFNNDVTLLEGWLTHYAADLEKGIRGRTFPAVAAHSRNENVISIKPAYADGPVPAQLSRGVTLECAVSAADPELVNRNLESLLRDIKKALAPYRKTLTITTVDFILPEGSNRYAFLQIDINVVYNEEWS